MSLIRSIDRTSPRTGRAHEVSCARECDAAQQIVTTTRTAILKDPKFLYIRLSPVHGTPGPNHFLEQRIPERQVLVMNNDWRIVRQSRRGGGSAVFDERCLVVPIQDERLFVFRRFEYERFGVVIHKQYDTAHLNWLRQSRPTVRRAQAERHDQKRAEKSQICCFHISSNLRIRLAVAPIVLTRWRSTYQS